MALFFPPFLEEEAARTRKECISSAEQTYLCHLVSLESLSPKQQLHFELAEQLYGKKVKELSGKSCVDFEAGELVLQEKAVKNLWKKMEHCHFSITQLSMNMGKLAGTNHICSFIRENSLPSDCDLFHIFIVKVLHHYVYFDVLMKRCERLFRTSAHDPLHCKTIVSWAFTTFQLIMVSLKW